MFSCNISRTPSSQFHLEHCQYASRDRDCDPARVSDYFHSLRMQIHGELEQEVVRESQKGGSVCSLFHFFQAGFYDVIPQFVPLIAEVQAILDEPFV